jgi:hypothetical protein
LYHLVILTAILGFLGRDVVTLESSAARKYPKRNTTEEFQIVTTTRFWLDCLIAEVVYREAFLDEGIIEFDE